MPGLLALRRLRHLFVFLGSILIVGLITSSISIVGAVRRRVAPPVEPRGALRTRRYVVSLAQLGRAGQNAVEVTLRPRCDTSGVDEAPTDAAHGRSGCGAT